MPILKRFVAALAAPAVTCKLASEHAATSAVRRTTAQLPRIAFPSFQMVRS
ncbi:MAG TPA: hypothetical protein VKD28_04815 [Gemmatimonadales bacterium]|nr:hypothetical protein [Gemmatimonadales bacterium]